MSDEFKGIYSHSGRQYISKTHFKKKCNMMNELRSSPILTFLA